MGILEGKKVIITGASGGIGLACAAECIREGAVVSGSYRNGSAAIEELSEEFPDKLFPFCLDLSDRDSISPSIKKQIKAMGGIDALINAAGIACPELLFSAGKENWDNVINCNLSAVFAAMQAAAIPMMSQKHGSVINISSVFGVKGGAGQSSYCASKAGIIGITKAAALELASKNIRVNAVAPGYIETAMTAGFDDEYKNKCIAEIPLGRFGKPSEVAELCVFLASDKSVYITGQTFIIDGGLTA